MDENRLQVVRQSLTSMPSRRDIVRGLAAVGLGLGMSRAPGSVEGKKKRKRKKKKNKTPQPNAYGCRSVGVACTSAEQCCSNVCEGNTCRAHGAGICKQGVRGACSATSVEDLASLTCHGASCFCFRTTAGSNYCSAGPFTGGGSCAGCTTDADCEALGFPAGSACAPAAAGLCGTCPSGTACLAPCDYEPLAPK